MKAIALLAAVLLTGQALAAAKWQGEIPAPARDQKAWMELLGTLETRNLHYGAMAAAQRVLLLFTDLPTKEGAYRTIIRLVDKGYPFDSLDPFLPGDLDTTAPESASAEPEQFRFHNSYNLYKSLMNQERGAPKWAAAYLAKVDQENFPKFLFHTAISSYKKNDLDAAEETLKKLLDREYGQADLPFVRKVARTLARILFDREQFERAFDIQKSFLLKLNPVTPSDWLEAAWSLYHMHRFQDAVGMLYNLESAAGSGSINLEKYTIRALVFRELCDVPSSEALIQSFEKDFGSIILGIKRGEPLAKFPLLNSVQLPETARFRQVTATIRELENEQQLAKGFLTDQQAIASYLFDTELSIQRRIKRILQDRAVENAARELIMMSERLRFLKFDVAREKFNPDTVFRPSEDKPKLLISEAEDGKTFKVRWAQFGDFWRDERLLYTGAMTNRCLE
jgi:tetratricopeptide (TPR) repeat protein